MCDARTLLVSLASFLMMKMKEKTNGKGPREREETKPDHATTVLVDFPLLAEDRKTASQKRNLAVK